MSTGTLTLDDLSVPPPPPGSADWNPAGVVIVPGAIDDLRIDAYEQAWDRSNEWIGVTGVPPVLHAARPGGWPDCTPYRRHPEILDLLAPLASRVEQLIGEPAGVHLNLTGWVTTTRDWHQDGYLNPPHVGDHYAAVWVALGDINPDSGPFQYVPGSHRWPQVTQDRILAALDPSERGPDWPRNTERILTPLFTAELERRQAKVVTYLPKRGDVLIWHSRLLHRGTVANVPGAYRPAFIAHLSGIHHRPDMPPAVRHDAGGWLFPLNGGPV